MFITCMDRIRAVDVQISVFVHGFVQMTACFHAYMALQSQFYHNSRSSSVTFSGALIAYFHERSISGALHHIVLIYSLPEQNPAEGRDVTS